MGLGLRRDLVKGFSNNRLGSIRIYASTISIELFQLKSNYILFMFDPYMVTNAFETQILTQGVLLNNHFELSVVGDGKILVVNLFRF